MNRRVFVKDTSVLGLGSLAASAGFGMVLQGCRTSKGNSSLYPNTPTFVQKTLPYDLNALEPYIDSATMDIHYNRHAAAYTNNMNEALKEIGSGAPANIETLLGQISKYNVKLRNNAGGHYNHECFWQWMAPGGKKISAGLQATIEKSFGSFNDMKNQFNAAATSRFGSGWAWLFLDKQKALKIGSTPNQDNPLMDVSDIKGYPLLGLDVWEHAYYLKYQNKRADYIAAWWNIVNWEEVERRYDWSLKNT
jgi:superoxide dismutase, Fe-Mn family